MVQETLKNCGIIIILIFTALSGCNKKIEDRRVFYKAAHGKDTALLTISTYDQHFSGQYEIWYETRTMRDSGVVDGLISGDTLRGKFKYRTYGGGVNIVPIIFLRKGNKLVLGSGLATSYMGLVFYSPDYPIEFDNSNFVFDQIQKSKTK